MSWMDSWSRPTKSQSTPPPLYLTHPGAKYCHTCGRLIGDRKTRKSDPTPVKYCSARCRSQKPRTGEFSLEDAFVILLDGKSEFRGKVIPKQILDMRIRSKAKGEKRIVVPCSAAEQLVFGTREDPGKGYGSRNNGEADEIETQDEKEGKVVDVISNESGHAHDPFMQDFNTTGFAGKIRPPQHLTEVNGGIGGEKGWAERQIESEASTQKRLHGKQMADEREKIKQAARRGCVFGFRALAGSQKASDVTRRKCEAVMNGVVVEPSFAKGDWGLRWRE